MQEYVINKLAVPVIVAIIGGFIVLWLWKVNTRKHEIKKLYLPLLNEFSASLSNLIALINRNYPRALLEDTSTQVYEKYKLTAEFLNTPSSLRSSLINIQEIKKEYLTSLNALIKKVSTLEAKVRHRQYQNRPTDYYVIDFIMFESAPDSDVLLNFPVSNGGFNCLFCDSDNAQEIYNKANAFAELAKYKEMKNELITSINNTLKKISCEQSV